jgi:protein-L-isoaspartate(D-aspartate) O-methyltransferase
MHRPGPLEQARREMLDRHLLSRGIDDPRVLAAMGAVRREAFVPRGREGEAYADGPLPIGYGQTISQPYIVAAMAQAAAIGPGARVLDVGTGSGYAAAVYAELAAEVYTIELLPELARAGEAALRREGYGPARVKTRIGDGYLGWPEAAPFDAILVAAAAPSPPDALLTQLREGGMLVVPLAQSGGGERLECWRRISPLRYEQRVMFPVRFVPLVPGPR